MSQLTIVKTIKKVMTL